VNPDDPQDNAPQRRRFLRAVSATMGSAALTACGGGGGDDAEERPAPTPAPTRAPTPAPTASPTSPPTTPPTPAPTTTPAPTPAPTTTPAPTPAPTTTPAPTPPPATPAPTPAPTQTPTPAPTAAPTQAPTPAPGNVINAGPSDYLAKLAALRPGDTLLLAAGNYGVDGSGNDTGNPPGLPLFGLNGSANAPITITGPATGAMPVLMGRSTHNTVRLDDASYIVLRRLVIDGRRLGGAGVATQGPNHHITIEDCQFRNLDDDQQTVAISTTGEPTWNWIVRRNLIDGAGTGMYFGNSTGDSPFVAGLIERNVFRNTTGYNMQIKRQAVWGTVPSGMPTGKTTTVIRHNVFSKTGTNSTGAFARPNLLVGDCPPSGPGSTNAYEIYGNFFYQNNSEALFQGSGNIAFYDNLMVSVGGAFSVQAHEGGVVRDVRIFQNTIVAGGGGISVSGGAAGFTQRVVGNAVFTAGTRISLSGSAATKADNVEDTQANSTGFLNNPLAAVGSLNLYPKAGMLQGTVDVTGLSVYTDWNKDFNGTTRSTSFRGGYGGEGTNPGWTLALDFKP